MQCYLQVKISYLAGDALKSVHEFFERLVVCLSQTGQGGRGYAMRPDGCVLHTEVFDKGVEAIYGSWWKFIVLGQCRPLEGRWEDTTQDRMSLVYKFA